MFMLQVQNMFHMIRLKIAIVIVTMMKESIIVKKMVIIIIITIGDLM